MKARLKFIPVLFAGYVVAVILAVIMWTKGFVDGFEMPGLAMALLYVCAGLLPVTSVSWMIHGTIIVLGLLCMSLRNRSALLHLSVVAVAGAAVGMAVTYLFTSAASQTMSFAFIPPVACVALAMGCVARMSFTTASVPPASETVQAPAPRWHRVAWGIGLICIAALALTFGYPRYRARQQWRQEWTRTEELLSPLLTSNARFPHMRVDRARDGSVFVFGSVQSIDDLEALNRFVDQAGLPRRPKVVVTVNDIALQRSRIFTNMPGR